jgi:hypothetical protein
MGGGELTRESVIPPFPPLPCSQQHSIFRIKEDREANQAKGIQA